MPNSKITTETTGGRIVNGLGELQNNVGISFSQNANVDAFETLNGYHAAKLRRFQEYYD